MDLAALRRAYQSAPFDVEEAAETPHEQFSAWLGDITAATPELEVNAAVLATADAAGRPSARHVLVKGAGPDGFTFFTNYGSRKAADLADNPRAALVFAWSPVARQVVAEGAVEPLREAESDAYFAGRPRDSQLGAWASPQSQPLDSRAELDAAYAAAEARFAGRPVPRPEHWGGYRLRPDRVEFWQGRPSRLHDRVLYTAEVDATGAAWRRQRLAP